MEFLEIHLDTMPKLFTKTNRASNTDIKFLGR